MTWGYIKVLFWFWWLAWRRWRPTKWSDFISYCFFGLMFQGDSFFYSHFCTSSFSWWYPECVMANIYDSVNNHAQHTVIHIQMITYLQLNLKKSSASWWFGRLFSFGLVFLYRQYLFIILYSYNKSWDFMSITFEPYVSSGILLPVIPSPIVILNRPINEVIEMIQHCYCDDSAFLHLSAIFGLTLIYFLSNLLKTKTGFYKITAASV